MENFRLTLRKWIVINLGDHVDPGAWMPPNFFYLERHPILFGVQENDFGIYRYTQKPLQYRYRVHIDLLLFEFSFWFNGPKSKLPESLVHKP